MEDQQIALARAAYARYGAVTDFKNFRGEPMPEFNDLPETIQQAWVAAANPPFFAQEINQAIQQHQVDTNFVSDGYHTFGELYEHRITLWIALCKSEADHNKVSFVNAVWRTKVHSDGSVWDGWFLLGITKENDEQITYHLPMSKWDDCYFARTLDKAPDFDGHTSADVLTRIKTL